MSMFNVNVPDAEVKHWHPKHGKSEDAVRTGELQLVNVRLLPNAASALLLAKGGASEVMEAFLAGPDASQRFWGIGEIVCSKALVQFANRHTMKVDDLDPIRVSLIDKLRLRFEGGPQQLIYADFSVHVEDPSDEETAYFHTCINRDVRLVLEQNADLVDEMIAAAQNMSVTTIYPNGELDLDGKEARDANQLGQAADHLESATAEIPLRGAKRKPEKKAAKKATKRGAKKKAA